MVFSVGTVKDTLSNVQRHVEGNLANGIDHVVLCLDAPGTPDQRPVLDYLDAHRRATAIRCDDEWWGGARPEALSARQRINANVVKAVLSTFDRVQWLFHLDGDEVGLIDRTALARVPAHASTVKLAPLESVSVDRVGEGEHLFKRLPTEQELQLLSVLGLIRAPSKGRYFHGQTSGKSGLRPRLDHWLYVHSTEDAEGNKLTQHRDPDLRHLHYESVTADEFIRKWANLLTAGSMPALRGNRRKIALAVGALLELDLPPETRDKWLREVFRRLVRDPLSQLQELQLLEHVDPLAGTHRPVELSERDGRELRDRFGAIRAAPKPCFARPARLAEATRIIDRLG